MRAIHDGMTKHERRELKLSGQGLCGRCGIRPRMPSGTMCPECCEKRRVYSLAYYERQKKWKGTTSHFCHGTKAEIWFLKRLGRWTCSEGVQDLGRVELLKRYRKAMPLRVDWGKIDTEKVEAWLEKNMNGCKTK